MPFSSTLRTVFPYLEQLIIDHIRAFSLKGSDLLFDFTVAQLRDAFETAAAVWRVPPGTCLYQLRHGGATHDILENLRGWTEVKSRGRWASEASLRRYAKVGVLQRYLRIVPGAVIEFGASVQVDLESFFRGGPVRGLCQNRQWFESRSGL